MALAGGLPAALAWRTPAAGALRESRSGDTRRTRRVHVGLVVVQVATSVMLLVVAALLGRSLAALLRVDTGVSGGGLYVARIDMAGASFGNPTRQTEFLSRILERLSRLPGVDAAALTSSLPPDDSQMRTAVAPQAGGADARELQAEIVAASPLTFAALGMPVRQGRGFSDRDSAAAPRVVILSDTAARRLFPGRDAVGQSLPLGAVSGGTGVPTVVGVVADAR